MTKIFISYRRQDTRQIAGRIFDRLEAKFGRDNVFMDIDSIPFGVDFHKFLSDQVGRAETVVALIGHGWADAQDEAGNRRLDNPDDFVRIEIEAALSRSIRLGAVLIDGAPMPRLEQLPESMRELTRRNAAFVDSGRDFNTHMNRLIADLERHLSGDIRSGKRGPSKSIQNEAERRQREENARIRAELEARQRREEEEDRRAGILRIKVGSGAMSDKILRIRPGSGDVFRDHEDAPEMVVVPAGEFMMESPEDEPARRASESPQHRVTIPQPFAIGRFPVTFAEWDNRVHMGALSYKPHDLGWGRDDRPVINVSWKDAQLYIEALNQLTGKTYRLPSEAEWEYAARAGTVTPFWWGSSISTDQANYNGTYIYGDGKKGEYRKRTLPVKSFEPNPWGLYQVHGNVWEWCEDVWHENYQGAPNNGSARIDGKNPSLHVLRGGSWDSYPRNLRSASRNWYTPGGRVNRLGFRIARTLTP